MKSTTKYCLCCGTEISGRVNKKFCNSYCRVEFHNKKNELFNRKARWVERQLRNNRRVLKSLWDREQRVMDRNTMLAKNFNFSLFTSVDFDQNKEALYYCYDFGYRHVDGNQVSIVHQNKIIAGHYNN